MSRYQEKWASLRHQIGRRGGSLLLFGALDLTYAWNMLTAPPGTNPSYDWVNQVVPIAVWAGAWAAVGIIIICNVFRHYDRAGFVAAIGIKMLWSGMIIPGVWLGEVTVGSVGIWLGLAGLVWIISDWPEPPFLTREEPRED